jgi:hypothetical protein
MRTVQQIKSDAERFFVRQQIEDRERDRLAELRRPPASNDARLLKPTRCNVLKLFYVGGQPVQIGATVSLEYHDAVSLQAQGKVLIRD